MIARSLRMNNTSKSSVTRLISYLTSSQGCSSRVGDMRITGCESEDATWAGMEMLAVQQQNTRAKGDKTYHLMLSFQDWERPSPEIIAEIENRICDRLGFGEHQRLSVVHGDTENLHLHIAINKIHPEKLTIHEPYYDHKELARACIELEHEFGIGLDNHIPRSQARPSAATTMEKAGDLESLTGWIQRNCLSELKDAQDWKAFCEVLDQHGLTLKERGNGFVFVSEGIHVKASSIDRSLSKSSLEKRLGGFEGMASTQKSQQKQYERKPMSASSSGLWERYQKEERQRQERCEQMREARSEQREAVVEQRSEAVKDFRLRSLLIRQFTSGTLNRLILHGLNRSRLKKQIQKQVPQKRQWLDWNKQKARYSPDSLQYLQSRGQSGQRAWLSGTIKTPLGKPEKVTGKGTRLYPGGIRERDGKLLIPNKPTQEELRQLLDLAERHFSQFSVHAPDEIKKQINLVAAAKSASRAPARSEDWGYGR